MGDLLSSPGLLYSFFLLTNILWSGYAGTEEGHKGFSIFLHIECLISLPRSAADKTRRTCRRRLLTTNSVLFRELD